MSLPARSAGGDEPGTGFPNIVSKRKRDTRLRFVKFDLANPLFLRLNKRTQNACVTFSKCFRSVTI